MRNEESGGNSNDSNTNNNNASLGSNHQDYLRTNNNNKNNNNNNNNYDATDGNNQKKYKNSNLIDLNRTNNNAMAIDGQEARIETEAAAAAAATTTDTTTTTKSEGEEGGGGKHHVTIPIMNGGDDSKFQLDDDEDEDDDGGDQDYVNENENEDENENDDVHVDGDGDVVMGENVAAAESNANVSTTNSNDDDGDDEMNAEGEDIAVDTVDGVGVGGSSTTNAATAAAVVVDGNGNGNGTDEKKENGTPQREPSPSKTGDDSATAPASSITATTAAATTTTTTSASTSAAVTPPPPVLRGTLSYALEERRHLIRGMWSYENSNASLPQRFELLRNLDPTEDPTELPKDGEFHGSFSLTYFHTTSKGKQKERSKVIPESGVKIKFTKLNNNNNSNGNGNEGDNNNNNNNNNNNDDVYRVDGTGMNQFGVFHINGTAKPSPVDESQYVIELRKRYDPASQAIAPAAAPTLVASSDGLDNTGDLNGNRTKVKKNKQKSVVGGGAATGGGGGGLSVGVSSMVKVDDDNNTGELPPPAKGFDTGVVCLRGKLYKEPSDELGVGNELLVHRISGMWSSGLDLILADPQNVRGLCNRFEYEHKSSSPNGPFPVSGRYSGWFDLTNEDGSKTKVQEKDVTLKFRKNNAGYHNVEGKGSNAFGKYSITGTLTLDNVITIFRQFAPRKIKVARPVTSAPPPINAPGQVRRPSVPAIPVKQLSLDDVKAPDADSDGPVEPFVPPDHPTYSAVSRGTLRVNEDGSHSSSGKWAMTRDHFNAQQSSNFSFRLEAHFAQEAMKLQQQRALDNPHAAASSSSRPFPLDSDMYKGSFQLKKGGSRYQTIVDNQVVMKFRENTAGSYNVYGRGVNSIGVFNLTGTLVMSGGTAGLVELYRMYPPELLAGPSGATESASTSAPTTPLLAPSGGINAKSASELQLGSASSFVPSSFTNAVGGGGSMSSSSSTILPGPPRPGIGRRESSRLVKVPSRLEDDDPDAQLARMMDKSADILRFIKEKDKELGAFFCAPVDPVALGIPTYLQVIKEPMDLKTLQDRMSRGDVDTPEEFGRLARLIFENAITFNVDPTHAVHVAARSLLSMFNQKYRDIERMLATVRRSGGGMDDKKRGGKNDKKRKRMEEMKSPRRRRLEEAQDMAASNAQAMAALVSLAPSGSTSSNDVTRSEFNLMMSMVQKMQQQLVQTYTLLAELSSDEITDSANGGDGTTFFNGSDVTAVIDNLSPDKKKLKKKSEPAPKPVEKPAVVVEDDNAPLTLQEQELLTETINELPGDHLHGVLHIIREAAKLTGDEEEIDLEIDQLDTSTQRKLLRYVSKFAKPKRQKAKGTKKAKAAPTPAKKSAAASKKAVGGSKLAPEPSPVPTPASSKPKTDSFFSFGNQGDSDSESEGEVNEAETRHPTSSVSTYSLGRSGQPVASKDFRLGGLGGDDDDDDDDDDDLGGGGVATSWNMSNPGTESRKRVRDDDDAWGAAREEAMAAKAREEDKKKREEKLKADAEQQKKERLAEAVTRGEELKAQRQAEEEEEARLQEEKEREAEEERRRAREEAKKQVKSVVQTVDFDAERDLLSNLEKNYADPEMGGASPSSDFGF